MYEVADDGTVSNTAVAIFTVPSNAVLLIGSLSITDTSGSSNTVDIHIDNGGAAAVDANRVDRLVMLGDESLTSGEVQGKRVAAGGKLYVKGGGGTNNTSWFLSGRLIPQDLDASGFSA